MKIILTGGTGFIGTYLLQRLSEQPNDIVLFTRSPAAAKTMNAASLRYVHWDAKSFGPWIEEINGADVVINLIGKNVFEQRWTAAVKQELIDSRVHSTGLIVEAIRRSSRKPNVLVSASAVGFYGEKGDELVTEESPGGNDFLAGLVVQWERAAKKAEEYGVRVANPRTGIVLQKDGGMVERLLLPFRLFGGGWIGSGKQYIPWVHMDDVVRGMLYPIENETVSGPYNLMSPNPVTMKDFCRILGNVLHRPSWVPVPDFALKILYGEGAKVIIAGQKAVPQKLLNAGYQFSFSDLETALKDILRSTSGK